MVSALEVLADRGMIREVCENTGAALRYDFTHEKLRGLVYDETSLARRRLLHRPRGRSLSERARLRRTWMLKQRRSAGTSGWPDRMPTLQAVSPWLAITPIASMPTPRRWLTTRPRWPSATPRRAACMKR